MTIGTSMLPELKIAAANFGSGGIDCATGSTERWEKTLCAPRAWQPHIVLCREISAEAAWYVQRDTGGSDRQALVLTLDAAGVAAAMAPEPGL